MKRILLLLVMLFAMLPLEARRSSYSGYSKCSRSDFATVKLIGIGVGLVVFAGAYVFYSIKNAEEKKRREGLAQVARINYNKWLDCVYNQVGYLPSKPISLSLQKGEIGYLQVNNATLYEPKSIRKSVHTGGAMRIAKGITIGRGYSTSESHEEWRPISTGTIYITNKRVVFDGDMQNRAVTIKSLISVQTGDIQVAITSSSRQKTMLFDNVNGNIIGKTIELIQEGNCEGEING